MKHGVGVVNHDVQDPSFRLEVVGVNDDGVVVGVEQEEFRGGGQVEQARCVVHFGVVDFKRDGPERDERIGRRQHFDDHLGDFGVRRQIPSGA